MLDKEPVDEGGQKYKFYGTFDDAVKFYRNAGRDDITIDESEKTVTFFAYVRTSGRVNEDYASSVANEIKVRYLEEPEGNYLEFERLPKNK